MQEQETIWNGASGRAWVDTQQMLDELFRPFEDLLVGAVTSGRVLDVGCGTGAVTLGVARSANATGIDISEPMLAAARLRAKQQRVDARFVLADAERFAFEAGSFDWIVSRFGVMFFSNPVKAFANLRHAAAPGASLRMIVWRSAIENPFMTAAERAVVPILPMPPRVENGPGQFSFGDPKRVHSILEKSGWQGIRIEALDVPCILPERDLMRYVTRLGPVGRILQDVEEPLRLEAIERMRAGFAQYVHGKEVRFNAACWLVHTDTQI